MRISPRQLATWIGLFGLLAVGLMLIGSDTIGQLFALIQLGGFVGAPLAMLLQSQLRSRAVLLVTAVTLSVAITALAAQSLIWFDLAGRSPVVLAATAYGVGLAWLLSSDQKPAGEIVEPAP